MIFVTVGLSAFSMDRLFKIIDELCDEKIINGEEIIAQKGFSTYVAKNYKMLDFISRDEHHKLLEKSNIVISHAGVGSVITALKLNKKVIVFPRLYEYGEHVDNHQLEICDYLKEKGYILVAKNKEDMKSSLSNIGNFNTIMYKSNKGYINEIIIDYIEKNTN